MTPSEPHPTGVPDPDPAVPHPTGVDPAVPHPTIPYPDAPIDPFAVVSFVQEIVRDPWPVSEAGREQLFDRLSLKTEAWRAAQNPHIVGNEQHFLTHPPIDGPVLCTWVLADGAFRQIYLQLGFSSAPPSPETTECFDEIKRQFSRLYGEASIPWHGQKGLRRRWDANGMELDVHYGNETRSSLMVSVSDGILAKLTTASP